MMAAMDERPIPHPATPAGHPYALEIDREWHGWHAVVELVRSLTPEECLESGYYRDPDWAVRDVVAHLGTWLAEGEVQFERMSAGTYEGHDIDVDGLNAAFLEAMAGPPGPVACHPPHAGRSRMLAEWYRVEPSDEAAWWIRKSAADHYAEHVDRLRDWVAELHTRRAAHRADPG
jgi:hypothetical protein